MAEEKVNVLNVEEKKYTEGEVRTILESLKKKYDGKISSLEQSVSIQQEINQNISTTLSEFQSRDAELKSKEIELASREIAVAGIEQFVAKFNAEKAAYVVEKDVISGLKDELIAASKKYAEDYAQQMVSAKQTAEEIRNRIIEDAKSMAEKIRTEANDYASATRMNADKNANDIRDSAQKELTQTLNQANALAKEIREKAQVSDAALRSQIEKLQESEAKEKSKAEALESKNGELIKANTKLKELYESDCKKYRAEIDGYVQSLKQFQDLETSLNAGQTSIEKILEEIANRVKLDNNLREERNKFEEEKAEILAKQERTEKRKSRLDDRENNIEEEAKNISADIIASKNQELADKDDEIGRLRQQLSCRDEMLASFEDFKAKFGDKNPFEVITQLEKIEQDLVLANKKLSESPSYALKLQASELQDRQTILEQREANVAEKQNAVLAVSENNKQLSIQVQTQGNTITQLTNEKNMLEERVKQLTAAYMNPQEEKDRVAAINVALPECNTIRMDSEEERKYSDENGEIEWLNNIQVEMKNFQMEFPQRIIYAFHTALKTSEMSPLTVLAGVSGTGKSELPRLYSHFGGINFLGVPVEPNWDCQESMLGFYNSIENRFEPTEVLQLLAQSQREHDDKDGLNDAITMVLLDEMNLANVELYFADFLSKLESRRGKADVDVPSIGVKIGSNMSWPLKLGRNVLWTGTMNNDETTKALSDKVIDRGIIINFPRPTNLVRANRNRILPPKHPLLPGKIWKKWCTQDECEFTLEEISEYKETIEKINDALGRTGRALGHRVWQSIESYMSLYPMVIGAKGAAGARTENFKKALDIAFEDQLVQKVMPKLRGLETNGAEGKVLNDIAELLPETLKDDFSNAKQGYGQFIWNTSTYLLDKNS